MSRISIRESSQVVEGNTKEELTKEPCNDKKTVLHEKEISTLEGTYQALNNECPIKEKLPSEQTYEEWLNEYENAD